MMPAIPRKPLGTSRTLSRSKPYEKLPFVQQYSSSVHSDDESGNASSQTPILDTADKPVFPTYVQYKRIEAAYLESLSPQKRGKALISQSMFDKIWDVLHQPDAPLVTPQFRFWVRKMFTLSGTDMEDYVSESPVVILHENRPVAVQEQLYELLCYCHEEANHGGRDKTCAVIRQHYSWVPKDLTAQFVKACPACNFKRSNPGLIGQSKAKDPARKLKQKQVAECEGSLSQRGSLEESWRSTGGSHDQSTMPPDRTVDVASSRNNATEWSSTCLPSPFILRGASSPLLLPISPSLKDLDYKHSRQMLVNLSRRMDIASLCMSSNITTKLPSLSEAYSNNTKDDQYKLNDLWLENISDSLPPELQQFQLSSPVRTCHILNDQIDPDLLSPGETRSEIEDYMGDMSSYSSLSSSTSPSSPLNYSIPSLPQGPLALLCTPLSSSMSPSSPLGSCMSPSSPLSSYESPYSLLSSSASPSSPLAPSASPCSLLSSAVSPSLPLGPLALLYTPLSSSVSPSPLESCMSPSSPLSSSGSPSSPLGPFTSLYSPLSFSVSPSSPLGSLVSPSSAFSSYESPYSPLSSCISPLSDGVSFASPILYQNAGSSLGMRLGLLPQSRVPPHVLPFAISPFSPASTISAFSSAPTSPTFDDAGEEEEEDNDDNDELLEVI